MLRFYSTERKILVPPSSEPKSVEIKFTDANGNQKKKIFVLMPPKQENKNEKTIEKFDSEKKNVKS